jgi:phosphopantothenoylcysteine decarboxylase/phosphopantothenate--cysteine ligase
MPSNLHIVLGVTGSIAAYKAAELVRLLAKAGNEISVMMTASASKYVGPLTFHALSGRPVYTGRFDETAEEAFAHIELARAADLMLIAPCTANMAAKVAHGIADDLVSATVLARSVPLVVAPAMNDRMWNNPATQANISLLRERGIHVLDVGRGSLACGTVGEGRMLEPESIVDALQGIRASEESG